MYRTAVYPRFLLSYTVDSNSCAFYPPASCGCRRFRAVDSCQPKIREMRVNGVKHEYSWLQRDGNQNIALRNMRAYLPNPIGAQICIVVLPGQCAAPAGLCKDGTCKVRTARKAKQGAGLRACNRRIVT